MINNFDVIRFLIFETTIWEIKSIYFYTQCGVRNDDFLWPFTPTTNIYGTLFCQNGFDNVSITIIWCCVDCLLFIICDVDVCYLQSWRDLITIDLILKDLRCLILLLVTRDVGVTSDINLWHIFWRMLSTIYAVLYHSNTSFFYVYLRLLY